MRNCTELLKVLNDEKNKVIFDFIKDKAKSKDFFIGIRDNYLNIYYKCASVVLISLDKKNQLKFKSHYKYLGKKENDALKKHPYITVEFEELTNEFEKILSNIDNIQDGTNTEMVNNLEDGDNKNKKHHKRKEKKCQQWIVNETNSKKKSDWYYVDLEYTMEGESTGRFDMIAVSKKRTNGKHRVALVELKVQDGSYKGMDGSKKKEREKGFASILEKKDELFNSDYEKFKFGSGIVGHIADYLRFLCAGHYEQLKEEIVDIIKCYVKLGILNNPDLRCISSVNDLADKPNVYIVSYTKDPNGDKISNEAVSLKTLKESMYKYLFKDPKNTVTRTSSYCLENCINEDNINGFDKLKEELFKENNEIHCVQNIKGDDFDFCFTFVDATKIDAWNCLPII